MELAQGANNFTPSFWLLKGQCPFLQFFLVFCTDLLPSISSFPYLPLLFFFFAPSCFRQVKNDCPLSQTWPFFRSAHTTFHPSCISPWVSPQVYRFVALSPPWPTLRPGRPRPLPISYSPRPVRGSIPERTGTRGGWFGGGCLGVGALGVRGGWWGVFGLGGWVLCWGFSVWGGGGRTQTPIKPPHSDRPGKRS